MKEITVKDFNRFIKTHKEIVLQDRIGKKEIRIKIGQPHKLKKNLQPKDFALQAFTTWSFPKRGNWVPEIPRKVH